MDAQIEWWDWAGLAVGAVGVIAFLMAIQPFMQFIWGRPKLEPEFERDAQGDNRLLIVYLKNPPVENRVLRALRVSRDSIQSLTVQFRVAEAGSGTVEIPNRQARIYTDDEPDDDADQVEAD